MSKIKILPDSVANKIAAGEVVERPASVVKELVENALDAGALSIRVAIEGFGCRLISVSDDGEGMDPDDAVLCLEPHATSKIFSDADINGIRSFGFRGEAMPSIASVSRMTVRTRRRDFLEGVEINVLGGKTLSSVPAGCAPGTEICVRDLFFNTPARKKFLKSAPTEEKHIVEIVSLLALSHQQVAFELTLDGSVLLSTPSCPGSLLPRINAIFGKEFAEAMAPLAWSAAGISVSGFVSRRGFTKPSRSEQKTFVNGRPVEALPIFRGIKEGCGPMLDRGRHHPCVLFVSLDPFLVDVNVHPAKREVRFRREYDVSSSVRDAVAAALKASSSAMSGLDVDAIASYSPDPAADGLGPVPQPAGSASAQITISQPTPSEEPAPSFTAPPSAGPELSPELERIMVAAKVEYIPSTASTLMKMKAASSIGLDGLSPSLSAQQSLMPPPPQPAQQAGQGTGPQFPLNVDESKPQQFPGSAAGLRILGIVEDSYIVAAMPGGMAVIDQHAAHERILFEKLLKGVDGSLSQRLLIPVTIEIGRADMNFIAKRGDLFIKLGFELEPFGQSTLKLNAIPAALSQSNAGGLLKELISSLSDDGWNSSPVSVEAIAMAACKAAVKAHDKLSPEEASSLLRQMAQCEQPFTCPHGRPTVINISVKELERRFGRK